MNKIIVALLCLFVAACTKIEYIKKPVFVYKNNPIVLREYKDIKAGFVGDDVCYSKDDYIKTLYLLNDLKDYIKYQNTVIKEISDYYEK